MSSKNSHTKTSQCLPKLSTNCLPVSSVPEAPTSVYGEQAGLRTAVVYWEAPEDNGSTITTYEVTYSRAGVDEGVVSATGSPAPTSVDIDGLVTGSSYAFVVQAVNSVGGGAQSEASVEVSHRKCMQPLYYLSLQLRYESTPRQCLLMDFRVLG